MADFITMILTDHATGEVRTLRYPDSRLDEILARCDAKFLQQRTDEQRREDDRRWERARKIGRKPGS